MKMRRKLQKIAKPQYDEVNKTFEAFADSSCTERLGYKNSEDPTPSVSDCGTHTVFHCSNTG